MTDEVRTELLDLEEPGIVIDAGQRESANEMRLAGVASGESNSHLKDDASLLRNDRDRPALANHLCESVKELDHVRLTASEEVFESELPARVPHVFGDEALAALRTFPEWWKPGWHV